MIFCYFTQYCKDLQHMTYIIATALNSSFREYIAVLHYGVSRRAELLFIMYPNFRTLLSKWSVNQCFLVNFRHCFCSLNIFWKKPKSWILKKILLTSLLALCVGIRHLLIYFIKATSIPHFFIKLSGSGDICEKNNNICWPSLIISAESKSKFDWLPYRVE